jgi:hypothetical protein
MGDWVPITAGCGLTAVAILVARLAPQSPVGAELRRSYGIAPSGARGYRTRRDHVKSAGLALLAASGLALTAIGAGTLVERFPNGSRGNLIAATYSFSAFLLGGVAVLVTLVALWKAILWRIELPDSPEHRRAFADAIDHLVDGVASEAEARDYINVRYESRTIEAVRRTALRLLRRYGGDLPSDHRERIKEFTAAVRSTAADEH